MKSLKLLRANTKSNLIIMQLLQCYQKSPSTVQNCWIFISTYLSCLTKVTIGILRKQKSKSKRLSERAYAYWVWVLIISVLSTINFYLF